MLAFLLGVSWDVTVGRAQPPDGDSPGAQVLTRGPVHEAFAGVIAFNPEPGLVVAKAPPDAIEEVPPEERPEGDNVAWIPGYWAWDDERNDFLWVSGTWRALPPGREWMAGYWGTTSQGYQWISGYWADTRVRVTTYLPPPPATVEAGPNIAAPGIDYGWTPGSWIWFQGRYAWRAGYWAQGQADWDWIPAHYVWTPRGYIFVDGFWDYPVERRGILFAPVFFEAGFYSRRGYAYSPRIVINLAGISDQLFLRPLYQHYYFGDYYAASYRQGGYYASYSFQSSRYGYDPFFSRQSWEHRQDRDWAHRVEVSFQYRRDHETARPPRTWAAQRNFNPGPGASPQNHVALAISIDQLAKAPAGPMRFQAVAAPERQQLVQRRQEVQTVRDQRRTLEARTADPATQNSGRTFEPARVQLPHSPIAARPGSLSGRNLVPPTAPQGPRPDLNVEPKSEAPVRPMNAERGNPQPEPRRIESERNPAPGRGEAAQRERPAQREPEPRVREPAAQVQEAPAKVTEDPRRNARATERREQPPAEQRARGAAPGVPEAAQRNARELPPRAQPAPAARTPEEPAAEERAPAKPAKKDPDKEDKEKPSL